MDDAKAKELVLDVRPAQTVISRAGAVMKVTRIRLSPQARKALRSKSSGIVTKKGERALVDHNDQVLA